MYERLAGMTGTGLSPQRKNSIRSMDLRSSSCRPINRLAKDYDDVNIPNYAGKYRAVARAVKERYLKGQPVLVGTVSIEDNELVSTYLTRAGVPHEVLNAKNHEREGEIIAEAGEGRVTVATNLAGRGVDIKLGGALANDTEWASVPHEAVLLSSVPSGTMPAASTISFAGVPVARAK